MNDVMIEATGVSKTFADVTALDGVSISVPKGTVLGLLGHNGAGKTTLVNILTTMLPPTGGSATVAGYDVVRDGHNVRGRIGLTGQFAAVDEQLSGFDNLVLIARLLGASRRQAKGRAHELLELFGLTDAGRRLAKTYSGGMRRRLDLAASLVGRPDVIFLDEPTTGLDPESRIGMWEIVEELVGDGTTVLLTTQYLEEADQLADTILVIDHGKVIASGTADQLKGQIGGERLEIVVAEPSEVDIAVRVLTEVGSDEPAVDLHSRRVQVLVDAGAKSLIEALRRLDAEGVVVLDVGLHRPTLDDVFLSLTGHAAEEEGAPA